MNRSIYKWKVHTRQVPGTFTLEVSLWREAENDTKNIEVMNFGSDGNVTIATHDPRGTNIIPTILLEDRDFNDVVHAFVNYAKSQNMRSTDESHMAGKLVATEKHLEDMRSLVFKNNHIEEKHE
jgi:UDP-N-acetylglucosamine pyrophosphorylase